MMFKNYKTKDNILPISRYLRTKTRVYHFNIIIVVWICFFHFTDSDFFFFINDIGLCFLAGGNTFTSSLLE